MLGSVLLGCLAAYQQPFVFSSRRAAAASIACVASPPIKTSAAAASIIERLSLLPATRSRPVNTEGLGRIVRSADTLRGSVLLQVLLHLKEERKWELAIALAALVEASFQEDNPLALVEASVKERTIDDVDEDDDEAMDAEFRRMVASSPNYVGSVVDEDDALDEDEDEAVAEEEEAAMLVEDPIIDEEGDAPHPMAALLRKGPSVEAAAAAATRMMTPLKGSAPDAPPVETTHYNVLIAMCASARRWQEALDLLQRMQQRGVPRDTVTYNSVLSALGRGGRWRLALATFKQMRAERVPPNTVTFASAIAACAQAGEWERALKLLDTCFTTGTPRNTIVYSSAISACEKAGEWRPALDLVARMEGDGIAPDATALNAAMAACSRAARPKEAEALLQDAFERHDVERTAYSYNSLLTALARSLPKEKRAGAVTGAQDDATAPAVMLAPEVRAPEEVVPTMRAVLARMAAEGVAADRYSYNPLISALSRTGDAAGAVAALREMQKLGIRCDGASYTSAITACEGAWPTALELLAEFQAADGLADEPLPYSRALTALQRAGEWQRACELLRDVSERGLAHNPMMTNMVLTACAEAAEKAKAAAAPDQDARRPAEAGLIAIQKVLEATRRAQMSARGPNAIGAPRRPPADRATVELTRRLLLLAPPLGRDTGDGAVLIEEVERSTIRETATARTDRPRGRGGRGGRGARGSGARGRGARGQGRGDVRAQRFAQREPMRGRTPPGTREYF
jgi:pentatricopeptide repeat domain-containing protein 1